MRTVVEFNGPGNNGTDIKNGVAYNLKPGDVVVIPAGTGHWFTKIDDHLDYLMIRIDPGQSDAAERRSAVERISVKACAPGSVRVRNCRRGL